MNSQNTDIIEQNDTNNTQKNVTNKNKKLKVRKCMGIKNKLVLTILVLLIFGFATSSTIVYLFSEQIIVKNIKNESSERSEKIATHINGLLSNWKSEIELLANRDEIKSMNKENFKKCIYDNENMLKNYEDFFLCDANGNYETVKGQGEGLNPKDSPYFSKVMSGKTVISDPVVSKTTKVAQIVIAAPIKNNSNKVVGMFAGTIKLTSISSIINKEKFGETGYAFMLDNNGLLMAHPDENKLFNEKEGLLKNDNASVVDLATKMTSRQSGSKIYTYEGVTKLASYCPIELTGWSIGSTTKYSELTKPLRFLLLCIIGTNVIIVLLILLITYIYLNKISEDICILSKNLESIANGDLISNDMTLKSSAELEMLSSSFNRMKENVKTSVEQTNAISDNIYHSANELNESINTILEKSIQISYSITEESKDSENQIQETSKIIDTITDVSKNINRLINIIIKENEMPNFSISPHEISNIYKLQKDLLNISMSGEIIHNISMDFTTNIEMLESSVSELIDNLGEIAGISKKLDVNSKALSANMNKFKTK